jgi:hypothetical protein
MHVNMQACASPSSPDVFTTATPQLAPEDLNTLSKAAGTLCSSRVAWFPTFGCALLALQPLDEAGLDVQLLPGQLALHLVCLDDWRFHLHRCT